MKHTPAELLRAHDLKATAPRIAVLEALQATHLPIRVQDIKKHLGKGKADTATVYRILGALVNAGIVRQINLSDTAKYFELDLGDDHHHIVCTSCSRIEEFHGCGVEKLEASVLKKTPFASIQQHALEFFGICNDCR